MPMFKCTCICLGHVYVCVYVGGWRLLASLQLMALTYQKARWPLPHSPLSYVRYKAPLVSWLRVRLRVYNTIVMSHLVAPDDS